MLKKVEATSPIVGIRIGGASENRAGFYDSPNCSRSDLTSGYTNKPDMPFVETPVGPQSRTASSDMAAELKNPNLIWSVLLLLLDRFDAVEHGLRFLDAKIEAYLVRPKINEKLEEYLPPQKGSEWLRSFVIGCCGSDQPNSTPAASGFNLRSNFASSFHKAFPQPQTHSSVSPPLPQQPNPAARDFLPSDGATPLFQKTSAGTKRKEDSSNSAPFEAKKGKFAADHRRRNSSSPSPPPQPPPPAATASHNSAAAQASSGHFTSAASHLPPPAHSHQFTPPFPPRHDANLSTPTSSSRRSFAPIPPPAHHHAPQPRSDVKGIHSAQFKFSDPNGAIQQSVLERAFFGLYPPINHSVKHQQDNNLAANLQQQEATRGGGVGEVIDPPAASRSSSARDRVVDKESHQDETGNTSRVQCDACRRWMFADSLPRHKRRNCPGLKADRDWQPKCNKDRAKAAEEMESTNNTRSVRRKASMQAKANIKKSMLGEKKDDNDESDSDDDSDADSGGGLDNDERRRDRNVDGGGEGRACDDDVDKDDGASVRVAVDDGFRVNIRASMPKVNLQRLPNTDARTILTTSTSSKYPQVSAENASEMETGSIGGVMTGTGACASLFNVDDKLVWDCINSKLVSPNVDETSNYTAESEENLYPDSAGNGRLDRGSFAVKVEMTAVDEDAANEQYEPVDVKPCVETLANQLNMENDSNLTPIDTDFVASSNEIFLNGNRYSKVINTMRCKVCNAQFVDLDYLKGHMVSSCNYFQISDENGQCYSG